jgi:hypothetical protein
VPFLSNSVSCTFAYYMHTVYPQICVYIKPGIIKTVCGFVGLPLAGHQCALETVCGFMGLLSGRRLAYTATLDKRQNGLRIHGFASWPATGTHGPR